VVAARTPGIKGLLNSDKPCVTISRDNSYNDETLTVTFSVEVGSDGYNYSSRTNENVFMRVRNIPVKVTAPVLKLHKLNRAATKHYGELRRELEALRGQTKKMKTQVVRSILNSSSEGQHILGGLDQMKKVFRAERRKLLANS